MTFDNLLCSCSLGPTIGFLWEDFHCERPLSGCTSSFDRVHERSATFHFISELLSNYSKVLFHSLVVVWYANVIILAEPYGEMFMCASASLRIDLSGSKLTVNHEQLSRLSPGDLVSERSLGEKLLFAIFSKWGVLKTQKTKVRVLNSLSDWLLFDILPCEDSQSLVSNQPLAAYEAYDFVLTGIWREIASIV